MRILALFVLAISVSLASADSTATSAKNNSGITSDSKQSAYTQCLNEAHAIGLGTGPNIQANCKTAEEKNFVQEFTQCLRDKPSILNAGVSFKEDCFERSQKGTSQVYIRCLQKITTLNIDSIGPTFRNLAFNATEKQCHGLVSCLVSNQNKGRQVGPSSTEDCSKEVSLSEERVEAPDKQPIATRKESNEKKDGTTTTRTEIRKGECVFDESGKQIRMDNMEEYQAYMRRYVMAGGGRMVTGPCP